MIVVAILVGLGLVATAALVVHNGSPAAEGAAGDDSFVVQRGGFEITIPASGELEAKEQIDVRNKLEHRAILTWIIEEGATVKAGDVLFRIADEEIRDRIKDAQDAVNTADASLVAAQSNLEIKTSETQSARDQAELDVTLAQLALEAWREGEVKSTHEQLSLEKKTAQKDFDRLEERYEQSELLAKQDFISLDELKQDEIRVIQAEARLRKAELDQEVYETYTFKQDEARKTSDVEQAEAELKRVLKRNEAELETARSNVESKAYALQSQQERLAKFQEQHALCTVTAPTDGWVVYASSLESGRSWRNDGQPPTVGTELRRNDLVIILPDTEQMIATVKVNESHSGLIEPGLAATVTSDAMPDATLEGEVISIGVLAESGGWIDRNRRDYSVKIALDSGNELGLKPSMRCKAEIFVGRAEDTLFVPVQAVFREGPLAYVYVPASAGYAQRRVALGQSSETYVEIVDGLEEGEVVLLREPRPQEIIALTKDEPASARQAARELPSGAWARRPKG